RDFHVTGVQTCALPISTGPIDLWQAKGAVSFDRVEFAYTADRVVLPEFTLDIPAGQTIALVGATGAGKSTLAKLIARFYDPSSRSEERREGKERRDQAE